MGISRKVPRTIVPDTIEGVAGLLVARKWDKAAIVYAWTLPQQGTSPENRRSDLYTLGDFADLGIIGLTNKDTVAAYRNAWVSAIKRGLANPVVPGDEIDLDLLFEEPFPSTTVTYNRPHEYDAEYKAEAEAAGITKDAVRRAAANKAALKAAIKADPEVADAAWDALQDIQIDRSTDAALDAIRRGGKAPVVDRKPPRPPIWDQVETEARRGEAIQALEEAIETVEAASAEVLANGETVGDEAAQLNGLVQRLGEVVWALSALTVEVTK